MDVQQPRSAENSIKICSLCFDTKIRASRRASAAPALARRSPAAVTRGASCLGHADEKWRWRCTTEQIYGPVAPFCCLVRFAWTKISSCALKSSLWIELTNQTHRQTYSRDMMEKDRRTRARSPATDPLPNHLFLNDG